MGHNFLARKNGDATNTVLAAGYNFRRLLTWVALLCAFFSAPSAEPTQQKTTPPQHERRSSLASKVSPKIPPISPLTPPLDRIASSRPKPRNQIPT